MILFQPTFDIILIHSPNLFARRAMLMSKNVFICGAKCAETTPQNEMYLHRNGICVFRTELPFAQSFVFNRFITAKCIFEKIRE